MSTSSKIENKKSARSAQSDQTELAPSNGAKFRTAYDYVRAEDVRAKSRYVEKSKGRTKQAFAKDADINEIIRKYKITGVEPRQVWQQPVFGDGRRMEYNEMLNVLIDAQDQFAQLPAALRARFGNDPAQLIDFLSDDKNRDEAVKLGLVNAPNPTQPPNPPKQPLEGVPAPTKAPEEPGKPEAS